jgi:hypothetical protein
MAFSRRGLATDIPLNLGLVKNNSDVKQSRTLRAGTLVGSRYSQYLQAHYERHQQRTPKEIHRRQDQGLEQYEPPLVVHASSMNNTYLSGQYHGQ